MVRPWTYAKIQAALPYITSIMRSLRERRLEAARLGVAARRLGEQPGRPDRSAIIAYEEAAHEARLAEDRFQEAVQELHNLDVFCLDPIQGLALVPFVHDQQLAWFVYDMFDANPLQHWRFHTDELDVRRPIAEILDPPDSDGLAV
jgi:hypothetical protein